jgi:cytochrome c peroxidase
MTTSRISHYFLRNFLTLILLAFTPLTLHAELGTPDKDDIEYPDDEEPSAKEISLGKLLFFDTRLSSNYKQSCASCHNPDLGFSDGLAVSIGTMGATVSRNTPHIYNLAWSSTFFWDGRSSTLEDQALGPIAAAGEMNLPLDQVVPRLQQVKFYKDEFKKVYGEQGITLNTVARAIASFERSIISDNSPYDQYAAGNKSAMSPSAIRGLAVFEGKGNCANCHDGANFTDDSFHNIGISPITTDMGRAEIDKTSGLKGAFKTPGLRNVVMTAPYMHDGSETSLEEVVRYYNQGGKHKEHLSALIKPLNLNEGEIADLVAFMGALTDPVIIERPMIP